MSCWFPLLFSFLLLKSLRPELESHLYHSLGACVELKGLGVTKTSAHLRWETWILIQMGHLM